MWRLFTSCTSEYIFFFYLNLQVSLSSTWHTTTTSSWSHICPSAASPTARAQLALTCWVFVVVVYASADSLTNCSNGETLSTSARRSRCCRRLHIVKAAVHVCMHVSVCLGSLSSPGNNVIAGGESERKETQTQTQRASKELSGLNSRQLLWAAACVCLVKAACLHLKVGHKTKSWTLWALCLFESVTFTVVSINSSRRCWDSSSLLFSFIKMYVCVCCDATCLRPQFKDSVVLTGSSKLSVCVSVD